MANIWNNGQTRVLTWRRALEILLTQDDVLLGDERAAFGINLSTLLIISQILFVFKTTIVDPRLYWWLEGDCLRMILPLILRTHYLLRVEYGADCMRKTSKYIMLVYNVFGIIWQGPVLWAWFAGPGQNVWLITTAIFIVLVHMISTLPALVLIRDIHYGVNGAFRNLNQEHHESLTHSSNVDHEREMRLLEERSIRWQQDDEYEQVLVEEALRASARDLEKTTARELEETTAGAEEYQTEGPVHEPASYSPLRQEPTGNLPKAKVRVRLMDGKTASRIFSREDTFEEVFKWIKKTDTEKPAHFHLVTSYPRQIFSDPGLLLADCGILMKEDADVAITPIFSVEEPADDDAVDLI